MKGLLALTVLLYCVYTDGFGQKAGDAIIGKWLKLPKKDLIIEVYKTKGQYNGKINWAKSPDHPAGFIIIEDLKYNTKSGKWEKGKIRDPNSSKVYSAEVKLPSE